MTAPTALLPKKLTSNYVEIEALFSQNARKSYEMYKLHNYMRFLDMVLKKCLKWQQKIWWE